MSYATLSAAYMDHICAMDKGYFRDEGLNIEVIRAPGGVATPGLLSGQFQFSSSASSAVSAAARRSAERCRHAAALSVRWQGPAAGTSRVVRRHHERL